MENIILGLTTAFSPHNLLFCAIGVTLGTVVGVLPGVGAITAISLLIPFTYGIEPASALILLGGVYYGAEYGGSTSSILLNIPGTLSNAITTLDGHPMAKNGRAGSALAMTTIASFAGGSMGILLMTFFTDDIVDIAVSFNSPEYFAMLLFGLIATATIGMGDPVKSIGMVLIGLLIGCVGIEPNTGVARFTLGNINLYGGIGISVLAMGLFGISEMVLTAGVPQTMSDLKVKLRDLMPSREELSRSRLPILRGGIIGSFFGAMPGTGPALSSLASYATEKKLSKTPEKFGTGMVEGISAPESANNAAVQTAFIPTLALGIPGTATMAVMMGALLIHGITPGPQLIGDHPEIFWPLIVSFWIGNLLLLVLNFPFIGLWVRLLLVPYRYLFPVVVLLICVGAYSLEKQTADIWLLLGFGLLGTFLKALRFEMTPLLIGVVLGPMMEENFRRSMLLTDGNISGFLSHPIAVVLFSMSALMLAFSFGRVALRSWQRHAQTI